MQVVKERLYCLYSISHCCRGFAVFAVCNTSSKLGLVGLLDKGVWGHRLRRTAASKHCNHETRGLVTHVPCGRGAHSELMSLTSLSVLRLLANGWHSHIALNIFNTARLSIFTHLPLRSSPGGSVNSSTGVQGHLRPPFPPSLHRLCVELPRQMIGLTFPLLPPTVRQEPTISVKSSSRTRWALCRRAALSWLVRICAAMRGASDSCDASTPRWEEKDEECSKA